MAQKLYDTPTSSYKSARAEIQEGLLEQISMCSWISMFEERKEVIS